jgi:hypothetical protein
MPNHTFTPGELVVHETTGERGILTSTNGYSAVVEWDSTGGKNPADILPVTDIEPAPAFSPGDRVSDTGNGHLGTVADDPAMIAEYPGMIPIHWDNGYRTVANPSILAPVAAGIEHFSDEDLRAELAHRGIDIPPANFTLDVRTSEPAELIFEWSGPAHHAATWEITTQWNDDEGLTYFIDHADNKPWTPAELDAMQTALAELRSGIEATAK